MVFAPVAAAVREEAEARCLAAMRRPPELLAHRQEGISGIPQIARGSIRDEDGAIITSEVV